MSAVTLQVAPGKLVRKSVGHAKAPLLTRENRVTLHMRRWACKRGLVAVASVRLFSGLASEGLLVASAITTLERASGVAGAPCSVGWS